MKRSAAALKPKVLITRRVPPEIVARLEEHFRVDVNDGDGLLTRDQLERRLEGVWGCFAFLSEVFDGALVDRVRNLHLSIVANMAVGTDNLNLAQLAHRGIVASNTPGCLTQSTADLAFALLMATARRITEAEAYLRAGQWQKWSFDLMAGVDVFGAKIGKQLAMVTFSNSCQEQKKKKERLSLSLSSIVLF